MNALVRHALCQKTTEGCAHEESQEPSPTHRREAAALRSPPQPQPGLSTGAAVAATGKARLGRMVKEFMRRGHRTWAVLRAAGDTQPRGRAVRFYRQHPGKGACCLC